MSETTDEFITAGWLLGAPLVWAGKKAGKAAYHGAQRAGIWYQNRRWGGAGESTPATTSNGSPAGASGGKWTRIETTETTSYYHHSSTKWSREGQKE